MLIMLGFQGISDPGMELAEACWAEGVRVVPVPGACAAVAAISVAGFFSHEFVFFGFVGGKRGSAVRRRKLAEIAQVRWKRRRHVGGDRGEGAETMPAQTSADRDHTGIYTDWCR